MVRRRRRLISASIAALLLVACASDPDARGPDGQRRDHGAGWFAVKLAPEQRGRDGLAECDSVLDAVALATTRPGASTPVPHQYAAGERWCVFAPKPERGVATRSDSVAQRASGILRLPAVAFWRSDDAWSYALFDRGEPVFAMESHYGSPQLIGDETRGSELFELPTGSLQNYLGNAHEPDVADAFATRIGAGRPSEQAPLARLVLPQTIDPNAYDPHAHPPSPHMDAGQWAVLPPMGVVLVKSVNEDGTYTLVDDDNTFAIPIERAGGLGMRRLGNVDDVGRALGTIVKGLDVGPDARDYSAERAKAWLDTLKLGDLQGIAHTYAEICAIQAERRLFALEQGLLTTSREWLAEEIATVQNKTRDALEVVLTDACD